MKSFWPEPHLPAYKAGKHGNWSCQPTPVMKYLTAGYFLPHRTQPRGWMFKRNGNVWMSLTKMETESQLPMIAAAKGHTVIAGLGMGFVLYNILVKPEVTKVTLLEIDREVVALMDYVSDWRSWPGREKLTLVMGDAKAFVPDCEVDVLYVDTWAHLGAAEAIEVTQAIQANVRAHEVCWWGQEIDFIDFCSQQKLPHEYINIGAYRAFAAKVGLPLIEQGNLIYPRLCLLAATLQTAGAEADLLVRRVLQGHAADLVEEIFAK